MKNQKEKGQSELGGGRGGQVEAETKREKEAQQANDASMGILST